MTRKGFLLLFLGWVAGAAPRRRNFSGKWKANLDKSSFGPFPTPRSFIRVVEQDDLHLTIIVESHEAGGQKRTREMRFSLDGEESVNEGGDGRVVGFARHLRSHILLHTRSEFEGVKYELSELWSVSDDGKTLTVEGVVDTPMGEEDVYVVFDKQNR